MRDTIGLRLSSLRMMISLYMISVLIELYDGFYKYFFGSAFTFKYAFIEKYVTSVLGVMNPSHAELLWWVMFCATVLVFFGIMYRVSAVVVALAFGFLFFSVKSFYSDGYYLMLVVWGFLALVDGHSEYSVGGYLFGKKGKADPRALDLLRYFVVVVLLYTGYNKIISDDWLYRAEPLSTVFFFGSSSYPYPAFIEFSSLFTPTQLKSLGYILTYCVLVSELISTPLLLSETPIFRAFGVIMLNFSCTIMAVGFPGGKVFYVTLLILLNCLWLDSTKLEMLMNWFTVSAFFQNNEQDQETEQVNKMNILFYGILLLLLAVQIIVPMYSIYTSGNSDWTREQFLFTWKESSLIEDHLIRVDVTINAEGELQRIMFVPSAKDKKLKLNSDQFKALKKDPVLLFDYVQEYIKKIFTVVELPIESIYIDSWRSFNGRPYQRWIDTSIDFNTVNYDPLVGISKWILPQIAQSNTLNWLNGLDAKRDQWADQRAEVFFFADTPGQQLQMNVKENAIFLGFVLLQGNVIIDIEGEDSRVINTGEYTDLTFDKWFTVRTVGDTPSSWGFTYTYPATKNFYSSINMA